MSSHQNGDTATIIQPASGGELSGKTMLKKSEACHQCRKRKVKCDAGRPCSNCWRTYRKTVRVNPHLKNTPPNCTYDQASEYMREEEQITQQSLDKLAARIEQLEGLLSVNQAPASVDSDQSLEPNSPEPDSPSEYPFSRITTSDNPLEFPNPFALPVLNNDWPSSLPPRPLLFHLVDLFFTCCSNSRRVLHRPTFLMQLLEPASSPRFPFLPILHAICAVAASHSPLVAVAPALPLPVYKTGEGFTGRTQYREGHKLMFDEENYVLSRKGCIECAREGLNLVEVTQACIIGSWWGFSRGRWFDHFACCSTAVRLCNVLGFNLQDSLQKPMPQKIRDYMLIGPPLSHAEVELRRNLFWLAYCVERYHLFVSPWPFDISDEDIQQTLPGTLEAFEAGVDDGQERQHVLSSDLFTVHGDNLDDFGLYVKCAIMLSRAHTLQNRHFAKYDTLDEVRNCHELTALNVMISAMRSSSSKPQFSLNEQLASSAISNLSVAHMSPHLATLKSQIVLANWKNPSCESAKRALSAARSILRYVMGLTSSSWDLLRLDTTACICWSLAGRLFLAALEHAPESQAIILREEIKQIRKAYLMAGDRVPLFIQQRRALDGEIVQQLGEREAAKLFQEDV